MRSGRDALEPECGQPHARRSRGNTWPPLTTAVLPGQAAAVPFPTTRWSLVLKTRYPNSPEAVSALETLCETYWFPVYSFIRRKGKSSDDARDLTQAFFTRVLEKNYFRDAEQSRGRFRTFLLASVRHFLANERDAELARKRGGGFTHVPIEFETEERRFHHEPRDTMVTHSGKSLRNTHSRRSAR